MDSIKIIFKISKKGKKLISNTVSNFPVFYAEPKQGQRQRRASYLTPEIAKSPLPLAGSYKVKAIPAKSRNSITDIAGYVLDINIPACTIGNNFMLVNDVYSSCRIALRLLKYWLLEQGCHPDAIQAFDLSHAEIVGGTPTFLVPFDTNAAANAAQRELYDHADAIHNKRVRKKANCEDTVKIVGSDGNWTWYINHRENTIRVYVKNGLTKKGHAKFKTLAAKQIVMTEGGRHLRIEGDFGQKWLAKNSLQLPRNWKRSAIKKSGINP